MLLLFGVSTTTYELDLIVMCVAVDDMSKISFSAIGGGYNNMATGQ